MKNTSQQPKVISYDLYIFEEGRWIIQRTFPKMSREYAFTTAKEIEQEGYKVRLVHEEYNPATRLSAESVIYQSQFVRPKNQPNRFEAGAGYSQGTSGSAVSPFLNKHKRSPVYSLFVSCLKAFVMAAVVTVVVRVMLGLVIPDQPRVYGFLLMLVFLVTSTILLFRPVMDIIAEEEANAGPPEVKTKSAVSSAAKLAEQAAAIPLPDEVDQNFQAKPEGAAAPMEPPPTVPSDSDQPQEETPIPTMTPEAKATSVRLANTVQEAARILKQANLPFDNYTRFGLSLMLIGQTEQTEAGKAGLAEILRAMGISTSVASSVMDRMADYIVNPKYADMIERGRAVKNSIILGLSPDQVIESALKEWVAPDERQTAIWTIMFTDIVGSTSMTQEKGEDYAQAVIRDHNTIVRTALHMTAGHEVKHTGDGIMMAFPSVGDALKVAETIQREVRDHNAVPTNTPFQVRIGLSTGTPLIENHDFFGTVVQLASRACAAAQPGEIIATESVVQANREEKWNTVSFRTAGTAQFKGFAAPQPIFSVKWSDQPKTR
jgi:class 3 adenylate cyclase